MPTCAKCIIEDSYPDVSFTDGVCDFCRNQSGKIKEVKGEEELRKKLFSKKGTEYDCVVPVSGGKDSSFVLYYIVKKLNLKPLAVFFDNGFIIKVAQDNVRKVCEQMGVDLVVGHANKFRHEQAVEALRIAEYSGRIVKVCGNCENNLRTFALNEATKRNIPFIVWGSTDFEDKSERFQNDDTKTERSKYGTLGSVLGKMKGAVMLFFTSGRWSDKLKIAEHAFKFMYNCIRDNIESKAPVGWKKFNPFLEVSLENREVESVFFYDYIKYDPYGNIEILKKEINWEAPQDKEARMDCVLHSLVNYQHLKDKGITADGFTLSVLVRYGLIDKESAMRKEEALRVGLKEECDDLITKLTK